MPIVWMILGALAGSQVKDGLDAVGGDENSTGSTNLLIYGAVAVGAYFLWKKVK